METILSPTLPSTDRFRLRDGREVCLRPIQETDAPLLQALHRRHSFNTRRLRFFSAMPELNARLADRFSNVDFQRRAAFVACLEGEEEIRAVARYDAITDELAEVAFVVEDPLQGQGLGSALFALLSEHARAQGFERFTAVMLAENTGMLRLLEKCGTITAVRRSSDTVEVDVSLR